VNGTAGGQSVTPRDAISAVASIGPSQTEAIVLITNATNQCNRLNAHQAVRNGQALAFTLGIQSGTTISPPTANTTYPIYTLAGTASASGPVAVALFGTSNASCAPSSPLEGNSGNVTLTSASANGYVGTFDVIFIGGDHLVGGFNTVTCGPLANPTPATSCGP
jgi:hypothetical protein